MNLRIRKNRSDFIKLIIFCSFCHIYSNATHYNKTEMMLLKKYEQYNNQKHQLGNGPGIPYRNYYNYKNHLPLPPSHGVPFTTLQAQQKTNDHDEDFRVWKREDEFQRPNQDLMTSSTFLLPKHQIHYKDKNGKFFGFLKGTNSNNSGQVQQENSYYLPPASSTSSSPPSSKYGALIQLQTTEISVSNCKDGFTILVADMGLISIILSVASLILAALSLFISNFYNVFGSGLSIIFVGLPTLVVSFLSLFGVSLSSTSPFIIFNTITTILDVLNNMFSIVPGSLFSDLIGLLSILVGKVSLGLGTLSSYPQILQNILEKLRLKDFIDKHYGCNTKSLGKFVQDLISGDINNIMSDS